MLMSPCIASARLRLIGTVTVVAPMAPNQTSCSERSSTPPQSEIREPPARGDGLLRLQIIGPYLPTMILCPLAVVPAE